MKVTILSSVHRSPDGHVTIYRNADAIARHSAEYEKAKAEGRVAVCRFGPGFSPLPPNTQGLVTPGTGQGPEERAASRRHQ